MRDPVCGAEVDPLRARAVGIFGGRTFYFCSPEHKAEFARDPERHARAAPPTPQPQAPAPAAKSASGPASQPAPPTEKRTRTQLTLPVPEPAPPAGDRTEPSALEVEAAPPSIAARSRAWLYVTVAAFAAVLLIALLAHHR